MNSETAVSEERRAGRKKDHPVLKYFLLLFFVYFFIYYGEMLDDALSRFVPGFAFEYTAGGVTRQSASGPGAALGALAAYGVFSFLHRSSFRGYLKTDGLKAGLLMMLPFLLLHYAGSFLSWAALGTGGILAAFLRALSPGFGEEIAFRGPGFANFLKPEQSGRRILAVFWLSSASFGLFHILNLFSGGDPFAVAVQVVYAAGVGMLSGAVCLRTGTLWPSIISHVSVDLLEFMRADLSANGGVMTGFTAGDWITFAAGVLAAFLGLRLMDKKHLPKIAELWKQKWGGGLPAAPRTFS